MKKTISFIFLSLLIITTKAQQIGDGAAVSLSDFSGIIKSGVYQGINPQGGAPDPSHQWQHLFVIKHSFTTNNHQFQLSTTYAENDRLFFRKIASLNLPKNTAWNELATRASNVFQGNQTTNGHILANGTLTSSINSDGGGAISLINPRKTAPGIAKSWTISNMTGPNGNSLQFYAYDQLGCGNGGLCAPRFSIGDNGNVGIGTTNPTRALEVFGDNKTPKIALTFSGASQAGVNYIQSVTELHYMEFGTFGTEHPFSMFGLKLGGSTVVNMFPKTTGYGLIGTSTAAPLVIGTNNLERMRVNVNGFVGIGTTNPQYMLDVLGTIRAKEVLVNLDGLADFVFKPNYKLMPLHQVEQYVTTNSHLPEMPTADEVSKNGLSIGEMQNKLLQKVEELTLYIIQQQKEIDLLKQSKR